jgi:hypothetical protein
MALTFSLLSHQILFLEASRGPADLRSAIPSAFGCTAVAVCHYQALITCIQAPLHVLPYMAAAKGLHVTAMLSLHLAPLLLLGLHVHCSLRSVKRLLTS